VIGRLRLPPDAFTPKPLRNCDDEDDEDVPDDPDDDDAATAESPLTLPAPPNVAAVAPLD
jgi:hypothetical protein